LNLFAEVSHSLALPEGDLLSARDSAIMNAIEIRRGAPLAIDPRMGTASFKFIVSCEPTYTGHVTRLGPFGSLVYPTSPR